MFAHSVDQVPSQPGTACSPGTSAGGLGSSAFPQAASPTSSCDCRSETLRIVKLCQHYAQTCSPPLSSSSSPSPSSSSSSTPFSPPPLRTHSERDRDASLVSANMAVPESFLPDTLTIARDLVQHWGTLNGCSNAEAHLVPQTLGFMADAIGLILRGHGIAIDAISPNGQLSSSVEKRPRGTIGRLELESSEAAIVVQESLKQVPTEGRRHQGSHHQIVMYARKRE